MFLYAQMPSQVIRHEKSHENRHQERPDWTILRDFKPSVLQVCNGENKNSQEGLKSLKIFQSVGFWHQFSSNFSFEMALEHG